MSLHTIIGLAGKRFQVQPSKTNPKVATLSIFGADRQVLASISLDTAGTVVASDALELVAVECSNAPGLKLTLVDKAPTWREVDNADRDVWPVAQAAGV